MAATVRQIDLRSPWPPFTREVSVMGDPLPQVLQPTAFLESESIDLIAPIAMAGDTHNRHKRAWTLPY